MSKHESFSNAIAKSMRSDDAPTGDLSKSNIEKSVNRLVDRRLFLKGVAVTGAVTAMYAVPKLTSVHSRPAYASITGGGCPPDFCIEWGTNKYAVKPIEYPGTIQEFYSYGNPDPLGANTPSVQLELEPTYNAFEGLEEITHQTNGLHGDILIFTLVKTSDGNVNLVTILDSPNDHHGGSAQIAYVGVPAGTVWSVEDDPDTTGGDSHTVTGTTANIDVDWVAARTDGGALTPPSSNMFDCNTRICVDINTLTLTGINTICFASQTTPPNAGWVPNKSGQNTDAPTIKLFEVGGDFCIDGSWTT